MSVPYFSIELSERAAAHVASNATEYQLAQRPI
jgi:hypothetical protein